MALRSILLNGDPALKKSSRAVEVFDQKLATLIDDMIETMNHADGVGLAAPQVGILKRVVVMNVGDGIFELVNPEIIDKEGIQEESEGCLSFPGRYGITSRPAIVKVKAQDRAGHWQVLKGEGLKARCLCHEIDHLNGVMFTEHIIREIDDL